MRWLWIAEAVDALHRGDLDETLALCRRAARGADEARLAAWGLGCAARAERSSGRPEQAAATLERALLLHEVAADEPLGQIIALGPGRRADDTYRAARLSVELGRPEEAWATLSLLDAPGCASSAATRPDDGATTSAERRRETLRVELAALERPASGQRREQRESIRRGLKRSLQELSRSAADCAQREAISDSVDYRAVPLDDEILLLRQSRPGQPSAYRRTPFARTELIAVTRRIEAALAERNVDDAKWRSLVAPLARALVPGPHDLGRVTSFALHGVLQGVPLSALPVPGETDLWLADRTVVAYRPAGAVAASTRQRSSSAPPLFVVDPGANLSAGAELTRFYQRLFPGARVLHGSGATAAAVEQQLGGAGWLHVDAHARYDPAFPELSDLVLADGSIDAGRLAGETSSLALANLSACQSGRWPVTADSGRFGIAGLLARSGVPWVVGARSDLTDALAADFNRAFYDRLVAGSAIPDAYGAALADARRLHAASDWAALLLLQAEQGDSGGQSAALTTLYKGELSPGGAQ